MATPIRILLIDDHAVVRAGLRMLLKGQRNFVVVGETGSRDEALEIAARKRPNIILLDLDLGGASGLDFLPQLFAAAKGAHVIVLTGVQDTAAYQQAIHLGAMGVVLKEEAAETLIKAIEKVHAGEMWLNRSMTRTLLTPEPQEADPETARIARLTKRELEVVALVCEGCKNRQIADRLRIAEGTVRNHLTVIFDKLGVSDRFELIVYAYRHNLAKPPR
jgi:DNA-binding NarL/FixJ family response regulator